MASRTGAVPDDSDKVQGTDAFVARPPQACTACFPDTFASAISASTGAM
jgi:hypothetical protein